MDRKVFDYPGLSGWIRRRFSRRMQDSDPQEIHVGLSLGAGGAGGLAHLPMLEALEELNIRPVLISGTSIGAIVAVLYCAGFSAGEMKKMVQEFLGADKGSLVNRILGKRPFSFLELFRPGLGQGGLLQSEPIIEFLASHLQARGFTELGLPCKVIAADFWSRKQVVFESGPVLPAIQASMAVPGLFSPVYYQDRVLVDGGVVNPVPFDVLPEECSLTVAVDVSDKKTPREDGLLPGYLETLFNSIEIMQQAILSQKLQYSAPDIFIRPDVRQVRLLQFHKAQEIYDRAQPAKEELKRGLDSLLQGQFVCRR